VQENVTEVALRTTLTSRFGPIKDLEIVRNKACAFLEFSSVDAARRAIVASLPGSQGGEGGIRIDVGDGQQMRITVETRKERGERPVSRPRGGAPVNGDMRGGGFRGRGGPGRGRGIGTK
jgi:RNA recognition motif. (a.k.a. RRM, RBD, or RNP domain)